MGPQDNREVNWNNETLQTILAMGFDEESAKAALLAANGDVDVAVNYLIDPSSMSVKRRHSDTQKQTSLPTAPGKQNQRANFPVSSVAMIDDAYDGDTDADDTLGHRSTTSKRSSILNEGSQKLDYSTFNMDAQGSDARQNRYGMDTKFVSSDLFQLEDMGYSRDVARDALLRNGMNLERAIQYLLDLSLQGTQITDEVELHAVEQVKPISTVVDLQKNSSLSEDRVRINEGAAAFNDIFQKLKNEK